MADDPLSRRALLRLDFGRLRAERPERPDPEPVKAGLTWRWEVGAAGLHRAWEPLAAVLCDAAGLAPGDRVLDAATGDGNVALEAARRGAQVTAYDLSPAQLERARERLEAVQLEGEREGPARHEGAGEREGAAQPEGARERPVPDAVAWRIADVEALPDPDGAYDLVLSAYGATLAPRPRRTVRELLRVLRPGGLLVLAAPGPRSLTAAALRLAQDGPGALPQGIPSPAAWGREDIALERIEAVAPGTAAEVRHHPLPLRFASEAAAWDAYSGPFGLSDDSRDAFADLVAARSDSLARVEIEEPVTLILARRG